MENTVISDAHLIKLIEGLARSGESTPRMIVLNENASERSSTPKRGGFPPLWERPRDGKPSLEATYGLTFPSTSFVVDDYNIMSPEEGLRTVLLKDAEMDPIMSAFLIRLTNPGMYGVRIPSDGRDMWGAFLPVPDKPGLFFLRPFSARDWVGGTEVKPATSAKEMDFRFNPQLGTMVPVFDSLSRTKDQKINLLLSAFLIDIGNFLTPHGSKHTESYLVKLYTATKKFFLTDEDKNVFRNDLVASDFLDTEKRLKKDINNSTLSKLNILVRIIVQHLSTFPPEEDLVSDPQLRAYKMSLGVFRDFIGLKIKEMVGDTLARKRNRSPTLPESLPPK